MIVDILNFEGQMVQTGARILDAVDNLPRILAFSHLPGRAIVSTRTGAFQ